MPARRPTRHDTVGANIRRYREEAGLSINQLAQRSGISKSYISSLENFDTGETARPSGETLYAIATALGVAMTDLLGKRLIIEPPSKVSPSLRKFAHEAGLAEADVTMLTSIQWRGEPPTSVERWRHIYEAIRLSEPLDKRKR